MNGRNGFAPSGRCDDVCAHGVPYADPCFDCRKPRAKHGIHSANFGLIVPPKSAGQSCAINLCQTPTDEVLTLIHRTGRAYLASRFCRPHRVELLRLLAIESLPDADRLLRLVNGNEVAP